ncbi:site-specific integrase [Termitidicoccus mucosus]|uniref:tyrosine-type recombinase/integrase n=1 Tax=Termitidicoccus mucosus TaxID=1184151 RepID=UPI00083843B7
MKETNPSFTVKPFKNRNGVISWRVSGWMHGLRIRRNFKDRQAAFVERGALDLKLMQTQAGLRPVATSLTEAQVREAEALFYRFGDKPRPLAFYADYGLAHFKEPRAQILLSEAAKTYLEARRIEEKKHLICERQMAAIEGEMDTLLAHFPLKRLHELSRTELDTYLNRGNAALKTFNNRRALVHTFFEFACHREDWLKAEDNPMEKIQRHRIEHSRGSATSLTAEQAAQLMAHVETVKDGAFVPYFALCLFAGIRPNGEITKLPASDVRLENNAITIEPWVSKVNMRRLITIQPNLAAWLQAYPLDKHPIIPSKEKMRNVAGKISRIRRQFKLSHDVLRHTFISMHVAKFRSMGDTALQAGNSESIIRRHYLNVTTPQEAETFFGIAPKKAPAVKTAATAEEAGASQSADIPANDASEPRRLAA